MRPIRLMRWIAWFALAACVMPVAAQPPPGADSLRMGRVALSLGMAQKTVISDLGHEFHVERARGTGDVWAVIDHGKTLAIVSFRHEKLSRVSRTWVSTSGRDANILANRLYQLTGEFARQGHAQCTLSAKPYKVGGVEGRVVTLTCGSKSIQIIQSRTKHSVWFTSLQEVLQ